MDLTIEQQENKIYLVDLKYALSKKKDILFTINHNIGVTNIFANLYSEERKRIPKDE